MKTIIMYLVFVAASAVVCMGQNCWNNSTGFPPIPDLGQGTWREVQGGLYTGGSNTRPSIHNEAGLRIASQVRPLDVAGFPDSVFGKIVLLSVGMSNGQQNFSKFELFCDTLQNKNPYVEVVNGAQGGWHIARILDPDTAYWSNIDTILQRRGLTSLQVQAVWFKEADLHPGESAPDTSFTGYVDYLKGMFKEAMHLIKTKFPNANLCYIASRTYGGYDTTGGNPEPFAYYQGWAVKELIDGQINGDTSLAYRGSQPRSPWLSWGPYNWADGLTPRMDGLTWICPDDYLPDGRHLSEPVGREKAGRLIMDFFVSDETTTPWFLTKQLPPIPPQSLAAVATGAERILLNWTDSSDNEAGFKIERRSVGTAFQEVGVAATGSTSYLDTGLHPSSKYAYRIRAYNSGGASSYSNKAQAVTPGIEGAAMSLTAFPNPFNPITTFRFTLNESGMVSLKIYNMLGQQVATLVDEYRRAGSWQVTWNTTNSSASQVASGIYVALLRIGRMTVSSKVMLLH
jgi:hypothetical protein